MFVGVINVVFNNWLTFLKPKTCLFTFINVVASEAAERVFAQKSLLARKLIALVQIVAAIAIGVENESGRTGAAVRHARNVDTVMAAFRAALTNVFTPDTQQ